MLKLRWEATLPGADAVDGDAAADVQSHDLFWHLGFVCLSPYRPTFQFLDADPDAVEKLVADNRITLKATGVFKTFYRAMATLDRASGGWWSLEFCRILEADVPIAVFDPSDVEIERTRSGCKPFWFGPKPRKPKPGRGRGKGGGARDGKGRRGRGRGRGGGRDGGELGHDAESEHSEDQYPGEPANEAEAAAEAAHEALQEEQDLAVEEHADMMLFDMLDLVGVAEEDGADDAHPDVDEDIELPPIVPVPPQPAGVKKLIVVINGGELAYFFQSERYQATCGNKGCHHKCILTRSARGGVSGSGGRPLGFMVWWLQNNSQALQVEHVYCPVPSKIDRLQARRFLFDMGPVGLALSQRERDYINLGPLFEPDVVE